MHEISHTTPAIQASHIKFRKVANDPIQVQMYTLKNGLRLFLSVRKDEPRIYTEIAVRAGSKHDPADTTGLAHYFEHMMFKGTDRLGTLDWAREKVLLDRIEQLFEQHRAEQDPEKKKTLYAEIDRLSHEASRYVAANEYDKLVSAIGAKETNAYTWVEQTVYVNDIPSNELERWFNLESERFRRPILRMFHTELETVFEEYNMNQDKDFRKTLKVMQQALTPSHPYGTQTTLGRGIDLKNPSQTNIYRFFDQYYVPNNMAIILSGDIDPAHVVQLAEKYFGEFKSKPIPKFRFEPQPPVEGRRFHEVYGQESPWVEMGWRFDGASSEGAMLLPLISTMLFNYQAGIFDLNVMQKQRLLEVYVYPRVMEDFSTLWLLGKARDGQKMEDVEKILLEQIDRLRRGDFADWLPKAALRDLELAEIRAFEKNAGRASAITGAFVNGLNWSDMVGRWKKLATWDKAAIAAFAQKHLRDDNFVVIYKHTGNDPNVMKVEKPAITPVEINRDGASEFARQFLAQPTPELQPEFIDFKKRIKSTMLPGKTRLRAVQERKGKTFRLHYCFEMGKLADSKLSLLAGYMPFLGTSKYTASELQQEFYRLGVHFATTCEDHYFYISLSGFSDAFEEGLSLMQHLLTDAQPNAEALENLVSDVLMRRENNKRDKQTILAKGMVNYAKYGPISPFTDKLTAQQLREIKPETLTDMLSQLLTYRHEVFYSGPLTPRAAGNVLKHYAVTTALKNPLKPRKYRELGLKKDRVLFVHFPIVQAEMMLLSKGTPYFNLEEYLMSEWHNQYFGFGLSSIVFQEIRESKALAYAAWTQATNPAFRRHAHWLRGYVVTQTDKLHDAVSAFQQILNDMPVSMTQIENARTGVLKQIAADRILPSDLYWVARVNKKRGFPDRDLRADIYQHLQNATAEDLIRYHEKFIKDRKYNWLVMGDRDRIDFKMLRKIGKVQELTLEQVFGNAG